MSLCSRLRSRAVIVKETYTDFFPQAVATENALNNVNHTYWMINKLQTINERGKFFRWYGWIIAKLYSLGVAKRCFLPSDIRESDTTNRYPVTCREIENRIEICFPHTKSKSSEEASDQEYCLALISLIKKSIFQDYVDFYLGELLGLSHSLKLLDSHDPKVKQIRDLVRRDLVEHP